MGKIKDILVYGWMFVLFFLMVSCEKDDETPANQMDRLFTPPTFTSEVSAVEGTTVTFNWTPISKTYILQCSRDSLLFGKDLTSFTVTSEKALTIGNLYASTRYSARIKCVSDISTIKDSDWNEITFLTQTENIFHPVQDSDIGVNSVKLSWPLRKSVATLVVSTAGAPDVIVTLSDSDRLQGTTLVTGLTAGTSYTFNIYLASDQLRGTVIVTTKAS